MLNASVPQQNRPIDLTIASLAVTMIKAADTENESLHRALDRAMGELRKGRPFRLDGNRLFVESRTRPDLTHVCTLDVCACETSRGVCWHRGLAAIVISAETVAAAALACVPLVPGKPGELAVASGEYLPAPDRQPMTETEYNAAVAAVDDLF